jgi:uncharacterized membrane protein
LYADPSNFEDIAEKMPSWVEVLFLISFFFFAACLVEAGGGIDELKGS